MTLTECKQLMNWYRNDAEAGIVQFNWRTTARWSLRYRWAKEENVKLQAALQDATKRAEAAEAALALMQTPCVLAWSEFEQAWEAQCDGWLFPEYYEGDWPRCPRCGHQVELQKKRQP